MSSPKYLSLSLVKKWEPEAARRGVSKVARSRRGFLTAYKAAGSASRLPEAWKRKRDAFVARHMAQAKTEPLFEKDGGPTRRHLALIMWAYSPAASRLSKPNPISKEPPVIRALKKAYPSFPEGKKKWPGCYQASLEIVQWLWEYDRKHDELDEEPFVVEGRFGGLDEEPHWWVEISVNGEEWVLDGARTSLPFAMVGDRPSKFKAIRKSLAYDYVPVEHNPIMTKPNPTKPSDTKLRKLVRQVKSNLTDDLLKPAYRKKKRDLLARGVKVDPMFGHCYVATETLYYLLGGKKAGWHQKALQHEGGPHWFLLHKDGTIVDATASQFRTPVPYEKGRGIGFQGKPGVPSKRAQTLMRRMNKRVPKRNPAWSDFIRGEYWIDQYGDSQYADLDIGDIGHEAIALDNLLNKDALVDGLIEYIRSPQGMASYFGYTLSEMDETDREIAEDEVDSKVEELEMYRRDDEYGASAIYFNESIPDSVGAEAAGSMEVWRDIEDTDPRIAYAKHTGAIQVVDTNFYAWKVTKKTLDNIVSFLIEMLGGDDELRSHAEDVIYIEEGATKRYASPTVSELLEVSNPRDLWALKNPVRMPDEVWILGHGQVVDASPGRHEYVASEVLGEPVGDDKHKLFRKMYANNAVRVIGPSFQVGKVNSINLKLITNYVRWKFARKPKQELIIEELNTGVWYGIEVRDLVSVSGVSEFRKTARKGKKNPVAEKAWILPDGQILPIPPQGHPFDHERVGRDYILAGGLGARAIQMLDQTRRAADPYEVMYKLGAVRADGANFEVNKLTSKAIERMQGYIRQSKTIRPDDKVFISIVDSEKFIRDISVRDFMLASGVSDVRRMGVVGTPAIRYGHRFYEVNPAQKPIYKKSGWILADGTVQYAWPYQHALIAAQVLGADIWEHQDDPWQLYAAMFARGAVRVAGVEFEVGRLTDKTVALIQKFVSENNYQKLDEQAWISDEKNNTYRLTFKDLAFAKSAADVRKMSVKHNPTLTPKDKKVISAFVKRKKLDGKVLMSDGRTLRRGFLGAEDVAVWMGDRIVETSTESTKFDESILGFLRRSARASKVTVVSGYGKPVYAKGLHLFMGGDVLYAGQWDGWVVAFVPGRDEPVGRLDYAVYGGRYSIKMVEVDPQFRRYGVATAMYKHLFKQDGITWKDVDRGTFTDEGYALRSAIDPTGRGGTMMLDADLSMYLADKGQVPTIGPETGRKVANGIAKYTSPHGSVRYVAYDEGRPVSVLQVVSVDGRTAKVANVFTEIEYRRKGVASKLMKRARRDFAKVEHSEHLTASGAKWAKKNPYGGRR